MVKHGYNWGRIADTAFRFGHAAYKGYKIGKQIKRIVGGTTTRTGRKTTKENTVTVQHDIAQQYRKRRMPRRKRRRWVKFVKKVTAVADAQKHVRSILLNSSADAALAGSTQAWAAVHLYGGSGIADTDANETGCRDLLRICGQDAEIYSAGKAAKLRMESANLDMTFTNDSNHTIEVDVYKIVYGYNEKDMSSFGDIVNSGEAFTGVLNATNILLTSRGATPFSLGGLISAGKVKILNKKKYLMSAGQSATLQHRDAKNRWVDCQDLQPGDMTDSSVTDFTYKRHTVTFLFIAKFTNPITEYAGTLKVRASRAYNYKIEPRIQNQFFNELIAY